MNEMTHADKRKLKLAAEHLSKIDPVLLAQLVLRAGDEVEQLMLDEMQYLDAEKTSEVDPAGARLLRTWKKQVKTQRDQLYAARDAAVDVLAAKGFANHTEGGYWYSLALAY